MPSPPAIAPDIPTLHTWLLELLDQTTSYLDGVPLTNQGVDLYNGQTPTAWARGGCAILAFALQPWLGPRAKVVAIEDRHGPLHVAVSLDARLLLDGYGISQLDHRLQEVQDYVSETSSLDDWLGGDPPEVSLRSFSPQRARQAGIPLDAAISARLLRTLSQIDPRIALHLAPPQVETSLST